MATRAILLAALAASLFGGIVRADDSQNLPGSAIEIKDVILKCDAIFTAELTSPGVETERKTASDGPFYSGGKVKITQLLTGTVDGLTSICFHTSNSKHEMSPKIGTSYVFFVEKINSAGWIWDHYCVYKMLLATDDNIAKVKAAIAAVQFHARLLKIEKSVKYSSEP